MRYRIFYLMMIFSFISSNVFSQEKIHKLLKNHVWGLHSLIQIDSVETRVPLGDSDSRITFNRDGSLLEYDTGIERDYSWTLDNNLCLKITRSNKKQSDLWNSFLRLEEIDTIDKIDKHNLILITRPINGIKFRYHYMKS